MSTTAAPPRHWWGTYTLQYDQYLRIEIGTAKLCLARRAHEWQLHYNQPVASGNGAESWRVDVADSPDGEYACSERYVYRATGDVITLLPQLADRAVVTRPITPFHLPGGEEITLYVSTPLWLQVCPGEPPRAIQAIPIYRPSDTWFGASTLDGELCYASQTHGQPLLDAVPQRPHRAVTPVRIRNHSDSTLSLERLNLPVPYLSLFAAGDDRLWTETVTMTRGKERVSLELGKRPPKEAADAELLMAPRIGDEQGILTRTFSTLFG